MCHFVSRLLFLDRSPFFFLTRTHCVSAGLHLQPSLLCCCTCMSFRVVETRQNKSRMEWHYPQFLCKYKYFLYFSYPSPKEQIQVGGFAPYKQTKGNLQNDKLCNGKGLKIEIGDRSFQPSFVCRCTNSFECLVLAKGSKACRGSSQFECTLPR